MALEVQPKTITLADSRASQQLLVSGLYADGSSRDLTRLCDFSPADPDLLAITASGLATGRGDGTTDLEIRIGERHSTR